MDQLLLFKRKLSEIDKISKHPLKSKDVSDLLRQCQDQDIAQVKLSVTVLWQAIQQHWIDLDTLIPDVQVAIATASHPHVLISLFCDLLRIQSTNRSHGGLLRGQTHPLVSMIANKTELIQPCIGVSIQLLKSHPDENSLYILEPFIKYVLLQPQGPAVSLGDILHEQLLQIALETSVLSNSILDIIIRLVSFYLCHPVSNLWSTHTRISSVCKTVVVLSKKGHEKYIEPTIHCCLSTCVECSRQGLPIFEILVNVKHLLSCKEVSTRESLCLSWLLMENLTEPVTLNSLLEIVFQCSSKIVHSALLLFKLPLVLLLSQPSPIGLSLWKTNRNIAAQMLATMEKSSPSMEHTLSVPSTISVPSLSFHYTILCSLATSYTEFVTGMCPKWLESLLQKLQQRSNKDVIPLSIVICALPSTLTSVYSLYSLLSQVNASMGPTMLAFTLYTLTHTYNVEAHFKLLQSLPTFCTDSLSTELVLGTLLKLTKQPHLLPMTLRLIAKCWEKHDKLFPYLRSFLTPPSSAPLRDEWAISAAATLKDICCLRSEQHGEECLPYISQLLSYSEHPLVINLLITALTNLSLKEIADPALLWKLLSPKLSPGINPGIDKALCEFFSLASDLDNQLHVNRMFKEESLRHLWRLTLQSNEEIVRAALVAITKFPLESHSIKLLPDSLLSHLNYEAEETISGSQFLSLALLLTRHNKCPMDLIVEYLLKNELGTIPRGVIYNATQKLSSVGLIDKSQRELQQFMRSYSSIEGGPSALYLYQTSSITEHHSHQKQKDHLLQILKKVMENSALNKEKLISITGFSEGLAWQTFIGQLVETEVKILCTKLPDPGQRRDDIISKALEEILQALKTYSRNKAHNTIGSLVGVACSELTWNVTLKYLKQFLRCIGCVLQNIPLPQDNSTLNGLFKIVLATARTDDILKSILLYFPSMTHCLSQYPLVVLEISDLLSHVASGILNTVHQHKSNSDIVQLSCFVISHFIQDIPYCQKVVSVLTQFINQHTEIDFHKCPLLIGMLLQRQKALTKLMNIVDTITHTEDISLNDLESICLSVATSVPMLACTGAISYDDIMKCVQVLAGSATVHNKSPILYWSLGVLIRDLYTVGEVSMVGLLETLAVRWIQEGQSGLEQGYIQQILSPLYGLAGLLGLSSLNVKIQGCTPGDDLMGSLLSASLSLLYQCSRLNDEIFIRNTSLWILTEVSIKLQSIQTQDKVPKDLNYLPNGYAIQSIFSQLETYCTHSNVSDEQAAEIITGLATVNDIPYPPVQWGGILIPLLHQRSCQKAVVKLVIEQAGKSEGFKTVAQFLVFPTILSTLEDSSCVELLPGLVSLSCVLSLSQLCSTLVLSVTTLIDHSPELLLTITQSLLSLLSSKTCNGQLLLHISAVLELLCQKVFSLLDVSSYREVFLPTSSFFLTLSQCLNIRPVVNQDYLKNIMICCGVISGDIHSPNIVPLLSDCLSGLLSPLEETWLFHAIESLCSLNSKNSSYCQSLFLTNLQECTQSDQLSAIQLTMLLRILASVLGVIDPENVTKIDWSGQIELLHDTVKHKLCEAIVIWLTYTTEPFHSVIQACITCVLSLSQLCSTLVLSVTTLIDHSPELLLTITQSLLSLLSSKTCNGQLLLHISAVLELLCQKVFSLLDVSSYREVFLPTSSFFLTLSQCLNIRPVVNQDYLKNIMICCGVISGDIHSPNIVPLLSDCLSGLLSPLEETWLFHAIESLCSLNSKNSSYCQSLFLTNLQECTQSDQLSAIQLTMLLRILASVLGVIDPENVTKIDWSGQIELLHDTVKHKLCEAIVIWLTYTTEPFHSVIQGLACYLRHSTHYSKTVIWTSIAHFL